VLSRCPGAKSTRFSIIPLVSSPHVYAILVKLQSNTANLPSGRWVLILPLHALDIKENNQHVLELRTTQA